MIITPIQKRLKLARKNQNLSQTDLAKKLGVVRTTVYQWETRKLLPPNIYTLEKIANILSVDVSWLCFGDKVSLLENKISNIILHNMTDTQKQSLYVFLQQVITTN